MIIILKPGATKKGAQAILRQITAAAACGADGLLIEVHSNPTAALSDGQQSLMPEQFGRLMRDLKPFIRADGRER